MAFDENKYKSIFESRFGSGSYESGLANARKMGQLKAQAGIAKQQFDSYVSEQKKAQKAAETKAKKKTYTDALTYFNDPSVKESIKKDGAYKIANDIKNDPQKQADIKAQGFNVSDYLDAMYNAVSDGKFRSQREYGQYTSDIKKQAKAEADGLSSPKTLADKVDSNSQQSLKLTKPKKKTQKDLLPAIKKKDDRNAFKKVADAVNSPLKWFDKTVYQPVEKKAERLATSITDGIMFGQLKKNVTKDNSPKFVQEASKKATTKTDKVIDTVGEFVGAAAPIGGAAKVVSPLIKPVARLLPQVGKLGIVSKVAESALRGGATMGAYGAAREGIDEITHPKDATFADRAKRVGTDALYGAALDPLLSVGGPLALKGKQPNERSFFNTVQNPEKLTPELQQRLDEFDKTYTPMSNQELVDHANKYVSKDMEKAYQFVKNARKFDARHVTVGHRLIDELQKAGEFGKALDVVERLAEQGTKAGQSIQSYSIYNRLSAEGQLLRAQRHVNRINQDIADPAKQVKLTAQHVEDISQTADSIQKFAGQMDQANNVMKIMDNVKKGKAATDSELETVRSFVSDAKKFFGDLAPNVTQPKVKPVKDVRTRDKVVDFMSKKEDVARKELQKIFGRANSLPVDAFYHLSVIGASKIAKGTVKLTDFTEEMAKEFGDTVRPYAKQIYNKAVETFNLQSESMTQKRLSEVEKITNKALKDKKISVEEADSIKEFARQVGAMSGDAKLEHSMELQSILQALERPTFGQKLSAAQTIAQLLNPKTVVRNALGNEMFYRVEQINKLLATPIDIARSKITGGERTITFVRNKQGQYWRNWLTGAKAGWKGVNPMGLQTQYDLGPQAFRAKWNPLTYLEKSLGATLRSFDHAGYMRAYNGTLEELAKLRAINEGLTGTAKTEAIQRYMREADENALQIADEYGKYATFQDNTTLSTALTKVKKGMNKVSTFGATENFGLGDLVLKYPKTPGNLVMRAIEYSPAGVIRSMHLLKDMATKNPKATREFYLSLSRAIMGTGGFSVLGYALANKGILTSAGNSDYEVASLEKSAGKQPNSVNITALKRFITSGFDLDHAETQEGDTFVSYDWAQPISIAIALGTGVNQSVKENGS
jgi:hypothetical protein